MSLVNNSANNFKDFLDAIKPYLNYQFYDLSGQGVEANNFSTDEKVIGTWIDGKPLYQKTVDCGALPNNAYKQIEHNISNLDKIVFINGISFKNDSSKETKPISFASTSGSTYNISADAYADYIYITTGSDRTGFHGYVTLRYTKTTDSAVASGEKIVGQWIDGKPVFEKVITDTMPSAVNTEKFVDVGASIDSVVDIKAIDSDGGYWNAFNFFNNTCQYFSKVYATDNTLSYAEHRNKIVLLTTHSDRLNDTVYITIRYTKSS